MNYKLLMIDPPWAYEVWSEKGQGRSAENHYPTQPMEWVASIPITDILDPKGALVLLWTTPPGLMDQLAMAVSAWGLTYVTKAFAWLKRSKTGREWFTGNGYYTRGNTEDCYLFKYGKHVPRSYEALQQVIEDVTLCGQLSLLDDVIAPVRGHSAKPDLAYSRAAHLVEPDAPKIELFARVRWTGWDATGLDLDGLDVFEALHQIKTGTFKAKPMETAYRHGSGTREINNGTR